jgi:hypothetical protein
MSDCDGQCVADVPRLEAENVELKVTIAKLEDQILRMKESAPPVIELNRPKTGECKGACRHGSSFHQAKWQDPATKEYKYACCKVDCPCMQFIPNTPS